MISGHAFLDSPSVETPFVYLSKKYTSYLYIRLTHSHRRAGGIVVYFPEPLPTFSCYGRFRTKRVPMSWFLPVLLIPANALSHYGDAILASLFFYPNLLQ